jgi:signal transduction histidine kinase
VFFSNVSHEFRTPLTLMLGPVEDALADMEHPLPPLQRERQELVQRSALRLQKLVNSLLDFARIEAGRVEASFHPTDLASLTAGLASSFRSALERGGLRLQVDCPPLPGPVHVDAEMWEKIDADRARSTAAGFRAHLVKPVELTDLERVLAAVQTHLDAPSGEPTRS